ncbi:fam-l protein [Plasmodium malariae]|uniref:Fam-l protein n=1 Tax=Plasmodium malariae TaxID=5858 RepID=A0A1D3JKU4_PLAMA|nr:fam-l protein [Plasmodium malariae]SBT87026.1 fam-l protein [Plasmodium malariae]
MEQKIKAILVIKISAFIVLTLKHHFTNDVSVFSNFLYNYNLNRKLDTRTYRLLAICKQAKNSSILMLKNNITNNALQKEKYISIKEDKTAQKKNRLNGISLKNAKKYNEAKKKKSCIFETKKYSHFEKKIFKELDYIDFLKNNKTISDKTYKKIIIRKYSLQFALPSLLFLLSLALPMIEIIWHFLYQKMWLLEFSWLKTQLNALASGPLSDFLEKLKDGMSWLWGDLSSVSDPKCAVLGHLVGLLIYFIPFIILGFTLILKLFYYHKKVKKYEKIKFSKR